jgi:anti-sigma-K factor RskA
MTDPTAVPGAGDLDSLLGAYALDALDAEDRARVDAYLERDATARAQVDEMRETAATLALLPDAAMDAPPDMWERIAQQIATDAEAAAPTAVPQPERDDLAARRARRTRTRWTAVAAVAAAIAIVVLAAQVTSLRNQLDNSRSSATAMAIAFGRAAKAPGAREAGLRSQSGATLARIVLLPDGAGYLRGDRLERLPANQTYQLWAVTGSETKPTVVSAGVLGPDPSALGFHASGPVRAFAVTIEKAGGVVVSRNKPVAQGAVA